MSTDTVYNPSHVKFVTINSYGRCTIGFDTHGKFPWLPEDWITFNENHGEEYQRCIKLHNKFKSATDSNMNGN